MSTATPTGAAHHRPIGGKAAVTARPASAAARTGMRARTARGRPDPSKGESAVPAVCGLSLVRLGGVTG